MNKAEKSLNDIAWERLFSQNDILQQIKDAGEFRISAKQMKDQGEREPRLMAKLDHTVNLPEIFAQHGLSILPITRGDYVISHFDAYHAFEKTDTEIRNFSLPGHIQSLDCNAIASEALALNCAMAAGITADFLDDEELLPTVSGRMGTGQFDFTIHNTATDRKHHVSVRNAQIEIDAAYEGVHSLALFEAKRDLADDFLVRQLYYPYRVWSQRVSKPVRPVFLLYSNGVYRLYEYAFSRADEYTSITLVKQRNYSIEDTEISTEDIQNVLNTVRTVDEPALPFPQANSFARVINICELVQEQNITRNDITEKYAFDSRQTNYYTDAARYLGLLIKNTQQDISYILTPQGEKILRLPYKQRQLAYCACILQHKAFNDALRTYFATGIMPTTEALMHIMRQAGLYRVQSENTYERRASTVRSWLDWIVCLINA